MIWTILKKVFNTHIILEINSYAWLIENSNDPAEIKQYANEIKKLVSSLSEKIAHLDKINELK
jgi:hypothetical protein